MKNKLNLELCDKIAENISGKEHSKLISISALGNDSCFHTYKYGDEKADASGVIVGSERNTSGELMITKSNSYIHSVIIGNTGRGKTQGYILNSLFTANGKTSYLVMDPKGEVSQLSYSYVAEMYGRDNVKIVNFSQPEHTMATINLFTPLAIKWLEAGKCKTKTEIRNAIITELEKLAEVLYPVEKQDDPTWQMVARNFVLAIILGLFEDLTLTPAQERKTGRKRICPDQINFCSLQKIFSQFKWGERYSSFDDKGFFTKRDKDSSAYRLAKGVIHNAGNTRANYMGFINDYINRYANPKIQQISVTNTLNFEDIGDKPTVVYFVYDLSDNSMREYVNTVVARLLDVLLQKSHKSGMPLKIPTVFLCDEFPTLASHDTYHNILATGRGSNIFLQLVVQSYKQLEAKYPLQHIAMRENCLMHMFLGSPHTETVRTFIDGLGKKTIADRDAFLRNDFLAREVPVVTEDYLMHRMKCGEAFINYVNHNPIHSRFELYYKTPEYTKYPVTPLESHKLSLKLEEPQYVYDTSWMCKSKSDDDDFDW